MIKKKKDKVNKKIIKEKTFHQQKYLVQKFQMNSPTDL